MIVTNAGSGPEPRARPDSGALRDLPTLWHLRLRLLTRPSPARRGGRRRYLLTLALGLVGLLAVVVQFSFSLAALLVGAVGVPAGHVLIVPLLTWLSSSSTLLLFLCAVPTTLAAFTYNSDLALLLLSPLSPRLVVAEKIVSLCAGLVLLPLVVGAPILIGLGQALGLGTGYDLLALAVLILLPVAPLSLAVLLTVAVLRWVPPARARTVTAILGALLGIAVYLGTRSLGSETGTEGGPGDTGDGALQALFAGATRTWWGALPTTWPGRALAAAARGQSGAALTYLAGSVVLALLLAGLAVVLSAHLFATGWATYHEVGRRKRPATGMAVAPAPSGAPADLDAALGPVARMLAPGTPDARSTATGATGTGAARPRPVWWPLLGKEWRSLWRDPQILARLIYPLFIALFGFYQTVSRGARVHSGDVGGGRQPALSFLSLGWFSSMLFMTYILLIFLALPLINREGRSFYLLSLAPLSTRDILLAKWTFCALPVLGLGEVGLVAGAALLGVAPVTVLLAALALAALTVALAGALLLVSLIWPRLDWDNPRRQTSGTATLVGSIGGLLLAAAVGALLSFTIAWSSSRPVAALATGAGLFVLTGLITLLVAVVAPRRLERLLVR